MTGLSLAFVMALPRVARAQTDGFEGFTPPLPPNSCFAAPDRCLTEFAKTHDRDHYDLCLLSERICRSYQWNWTLNQRVIAGYPTMIEGIPAVINSVGELLRVCRGKQAWEQDACHQSIAPWTYRAALRGESWRSWRKSRVAVACTSSASLSEQAYEKAFVNWAERHPSKHRLSVIDGVIAATAAAWPCPGESAKQRRARRMRTHDRSRNGRM
jgi:hypothetical protein